VLQFLIDSLQAQGHQQLNCLQPSIQMFHLLDRFGDHLADLDTPFDDLLPC